MKHIRLFENFNELSHSNIVSICKKYDIENYTINSDGTVDVDGTVDLISKDLTRLPLKFGIVSGSFLCNKNKLTSLEGSPRIVIGSFQCHTNKLTSLKGGPKSTGDFSCSSNRLTSLEGGPIITGDYYLDSNDVIDFIGFPDSCKTIFCNNNPIHNIWILFKDKTKIELFNYMDPIRPAEVEGGKPIVILDVLNAFLEEIGKEKVITLEGYEVV